MRWNDPDVNMAHLAEEVIAAGVSGTFRLTVQGLPLAGSHNRRRSGERVVERKKTL
jgi:hypothetical protein